MKRFVHLGINPIGGAASNPGVVGWPQNYVLILENFLNSNVNGDWFRYAAQNYILWTDLDLNQLAAAIAAQPGFHVVYVFLSEFTSAQFGGWMPKLFWDWLQQSR
jgi:hypothetical protein